MKKILPSFIILGTGLICLASCNIKKPSNSSNNIANSTATSNITTNPNIPTSSANTTNSNNSTSKPTNTISTPTSSPSNTTSNTAIPSSSATNIEYNLDLTKITATVDKQSLTADTLNNPFLTIVDSSKVTARYKTENYCIENKDANLKVTFKGTGTITIGYCSTSGINNSRIRLVNSKGEYITATSFNGYTYQADENAYEIIGSTATPITFTITEAGEYTIDCVSTKAGRGGRIYSIEMVDTYAVTIDKSVVSENTTWSFRTDTSTGNEISTVVQGTTETLADEKRRYNN